MITVKLKKEFGWTIDNMPESIFRFAQANLQSINGDIIFDVRDARWGDMLLSTVRGLVPDAIYRNIGNVMEFEIPRVEQEAPIRNAGIRGGQRRIGAGVTQQPTTTQAAQAPIQPAPPQPAQPICGDCGEPVHRCGCPRCPTCHELEGDCACDHYQFRDVHNEGSATAALNTLASSEKIPKDNITQLIASKLDGDIAGKAKMLADKYIQYNRLMANLMAMQNDISRLSSMVGANPIVELFNAQITKLMSSQNNMIKDIFFTQDYLVVQTKNIVTNPMSDGAQRDIGEMEFYIRLDSLLGTTDHGHTPILIRNCTREGTNQECGHVNMGGVPCFGSWMEPILKATMSKDLDQLVDLLIRYIRSPNEDDCMGRPILNWPIITGETNEARS